VITARVWYISEADSNKLFALSLELSSGSETSGGAYISTRPSTNTTTAGPTATGDLVISREFEALSYILSPTNDTDMIEVSFNRIDNGGGSYSLATYTDKDFYLLGLELLFIGEGESQGTLPGYMMKA